MGAVSDNQKPWKIRVHAKAKYFNLKFKATNIPRPTKNKAIPTSNFGHPEANFPVNYLRQFGYEEPICVTSIVVGYLALLFQEGYISNYLWKAWNFAASYGQVVLSSFSQDMRAHRGDNYLG
ncbi:hypothetical protein F0562_017836 [Nyssa sinensis]|uniref:Uncharacterized protein n=1 Tax=Nyssa sinensis TaxID=561372 RepID=A0A5J4ZI31_9ASTE|nr:hypothetical protein F0562_017836 [Nyssa sinensis]